MGLVTVDFDGTLYQGNSFKAMFQAAKKDFTLREWIIVLIGVVQAVFMGVLKGKEAFRHAFFKAFAKSFKGKTKEELAHFFQQLVQIGKREVNHDLLHKIRKHEEEGNTVIIVSGALIPFLKAFTREVGLDVHVIGTDIYYDSNGICTGEISTIVNGEEKVKKVQYWMDQQEKEKIEEREIWAYADSESDIPLFEFVQHPVVVNPNETMRKIAEENQWVIFA